MLHEGFKVPSFFSGRLFALAQPVADERDNIGVGELRGALARRQPRGDQVDKLRRRQVGRDLAQRRAQFEGLDESGFHLLAPSAPVAGDGSGFRLQKPQMPCIEGNADDLFPSRAPIVDGRFWLARPSHAIPRCAYVS